jgi:integrase
VDPEERTILCRRLKSGVDSVHPLSPGEVQKLRDHHKQSGGGPLVFPSERGRRMHRQNLNRIVERACLGIEITVTPHKLRHSTGYALVKARLPIRNVQAFLGHASIGSTLVYAHLDETRFTGAVEALS